MRPVPGNVLLATYSWIFAVSLTAATDADDAAPVFGFSVTASVAAFCDSTMCRG